VPQQKGDTTQTPASVTAPATKDKAPVSTTATYVNDELGLAFDHPKDWKISRVKVKNNTKIVITDPKSWRPAKYDSTTRFLIPIPGAAEKGVLEIFAATFNQDEDTWQTVQRDINQKMNRTIVRQWSEEILGVPLLMTKIEAKDKGLDTITETGLMYSATPRKLIFRLSASPDNFDKADYEWRQVLPSVRTTDGQLPSAEDPNRKLTARDMAPGTFHREIWTAPVPKALPLIKGTTIGDATSGGKKVYLRGLSGWKSVKNSDGTLTLTSPELNGSVKVIVANDLDSENPAKVLMRSSGEDLAKFKKVIKREEKGPFPNRGLAQVDWIFRRGTADASKPIFSFEAAGVNGDDYWVMTWMSNDPSANGKDRKALESLVDVLHLDTTP
jgi:hypothetical protein